jgi:hypothetical protein
MRSGVGVPMIRFAVLVPRIVAAVAVDVNSRNRRRKAVRRTAAAQSTLDA